MKLLCVGVMFYAAVTANTPSSPGEGQGRLFPSVSTGCDARKPRLDPGSELRPGSLMAGADPMGVKPQLWPVGRLGAGAWPGPSSWSCLGSPDSLGVHPEDLHLDREPE